VQATVGMLAGAGKKHVARLHAARIQMQLGLCAPIRLHTGAQPVQQLITVLGE